MNYTSEIALDSRPARTRRIKCFIHISHFISLENNENDNNNESDDNDDAYLLAENGRFAQRRRRCVATAVRDSLTFD